MIELYRKFVRMQGSDYPMEIHVYGISIEKVKVDLAILISLLCTYMENNPYCTTISKMFLLSKGNPKRITYILQT